MLVTRVEHVRPAASTSNSVSLCDRTDFRVDCRVDIEGVRQGHVAHHFSGRRIGDFSVPRRVRCHRPAADP
jgi:hypothetical protein